MDEPGWEEDDSGEEGERWPLNQPKMNVLWLFLGIALLLAAGILVVLFFIVSDISSQHACFAALLLYLMMFPFLGGWFITAGWLTMWKYRRYRFRHLKAPRDVIADELEACFEELSLGFEIKHPLVERLLLMVQSTPGDSSLPTGISMWTLFPLPDQNMSKSIILFSLVPVTKNYLPLWIFSPATLTRDSVVLKRITGMTTHLCSSLVPPSFIAGIVGRK